MLLAHPDLIVEIEDSPDLGGSLVVAREGSGLRDEALDVLYEQATRITARIGGTPPP
jgi:hypothetical protein